MRRSMLKLVWFLMLTAFASEGFGQGTVNFFNSPTTLISILAPPPNNLMPANSNAVFYFALLTAPVGTIDPRSFTFSGAYGTNQFVAGRFTGGAVPINGWAPGVTRSFMVVGWSGDVLGHDFQPAWLTGNFPGLGFSQIAQGSPGGFVPSTGGTEPNLAVFNATTIGRGFTISVPEPVGAALAGLAVVSMLIFRRRLPLGPKRA